METLLIEESLSLIGWLTRIQRTERDKTPVPEYYEKAIISLGNMIKVSNDLLKAYKELKL